MYKEDTFEWVKSTFLSLTSKTYPFGCEDGLVYDMIESGIFPRDLEIDQHGNYLYKIGDSRTIFASHLDTNCHDQTSVVHVITNDPDGNIIVETDGKTILGADDKAGVTILLWMIKNRIPGIYYFFIGEEVGCIGSKAASRKILEFKGIYDRIISFDRRGTDSVITHQSSKRTCSDGFAEALSDKLNQKNNFLYQKDNTGIYTDSAEFSSIISECTNISVGYYYEHTTKEFQDLTHLSNLADVCITFDWENLPSLRDPNRIDYNNSYYDDYCDGFGYGRRVSGSGCRVKNMITEVPEKKKKRSRRKRINNSKVYLDSGNGSLSFMYKHKDKPQITDKYGLFRYTFNILTKKDINDIKDQYLDQNDESDIKYYDYMIRKLETTT